MTIQSGITQDYTKTIGTLASSELVATAHKWRAYTPKAAVFVVYALLLFIENLKK
jgi:hypothetical protein